jgi:mannose-6-phosphate isomerase, type 1 (EC 5.3.1.8)
MTSNQRS